MEMRVSVEETLEQLLGEMKNEVNLRSMKELWAEVKAQIRPIRMDLQSLLKTIVHLNESKLFND